MKIKMLENQQKLREKKEDPENMTEQEKNKQINDVLEDMCIYGEATKKEIKEEKEKHPEKFVETSQALTMENQDSGLFALGLISSNLEELGIETAIEKDENPNEQNNDLTCMQFLSNGMVNKKKYDLHFELGEKRNDEVLNNKEEYEKFKENLKLKLSKDYNIPPEKIIVTLPQKGSFHVQVIFQSDEFDENDPISLKSYLDTILPPKESTEEGQIYMQFVSCEPADKTNVIQLSKMLENQMKIRQAKETGLCNNREEIYSECFDELIRQVTINSLQRGELLNHVKDQMKETINYYQKLYESSMAFAMRKVLREQKKKSKLMARESKLEMDIEQLQKEIELKEKELLKKESDDKEKRQANNEDHQEDCKNIQADCQQKLDTIREKLTTPKK